MKKRNTGQRRNARYRAQPVDPVTGKRRSISASSQAELESRLRRLRDVRDGVKYGDIDERDAVAALRPTLGLRFRVVDAWDRYRPGVSAASARIADNHWKYRLSEFAERTVGELDAATMRAWERRLLAAGSAPKTITGAYEALAKAVGLAVDAGLCAGLPWGRWRPAPSREPRVRREAARNIEELLAILAAARALDVPRWERGHYCSRFYACLWLGLTGMRQAEAAGLSWDSVEIDGPVPYVRIWRQAPRRWHRRPGQSLERGSTVPPKGGKERTQTLHPSAALVLRHQRTQLQDAGRYRVDGPVFPARGSSWLVVGRVLHPDHFRRVVTAAGIEGAIERWSPHSLRHSIATLEAVASGGDLRSVQARTGHSDLRVLEGYLHRAGRGLAASRVPELPPALTHPQQGVIEAPAAPVEVQGQDALTVLASHARATDYQQSVDAGKRAARAEGERPFAELAREWIAAGRPGPRPKAVTDATRRAYARAYNQERYRSADAERAREAGYRARRACLGAWGRALRAVERTG